MFREARRVDRADPERYERADVPEYGLLQGERKLR
jgi:hypothetical protein